MFAAVQIVEGETAHQTVGAFMRSADQHGARFGLLEVLGVVPMGRLKMLRFRVNCTKQEPVKRTLESLAPYRGIILQRDAVYSVELPDGTRSQVPSLTMTCVAEPTFKKTYRGVSAQFWERQFR